MDPQSKILRQDLSLPGLPRYERDCTKLEAMLEAPVTLKLVSETNLNIAGAKDIKLLSECIPNSINPDNDLLGVCGGRNVTVFNVADNRLVQAYEDELDTEDFCALTWGLVSDCETLLPWLFVGTKKGLIKSLDTSEGCFVNELVGHLGAVTELRLRSAEDRLQIFLLTASLDNTVRMWNVLTQVQIAVFGGVLAHSQGVMTLDLHPSLNIFVTGGADSKVMVWSIGDDVVTKMHESTEADRRVMRSHEGIWCSTRQFKTIYDLEPIYETARVHSTIVDCVRFAGNLLVSKAQEGLLVVWKPNTSLWKDGVVVLYTLPIEESFMFPLKFVMFKPLDLLYIGGLHGELRVFSLLTGRKQVGSLRLRSEDLVSRTCICLTGDRGYALSSRLHAFTLDLA